MEFIASQIAAAVNVRSLYPASHPRVTQSITELEGAIAQGLADGASDVTFILIGDDLVVGDQVIRASTFFLVREFIHLLQERGVERLTLAVGIETEELHRFVSALATGGELASSPHLILGHAQLVAESDTPGEKHRELSQDQLDAAREAWARFRVERRLPIEQLEELVWSLIDTLGRSARGMLPLAKLRSHDEYTFVHSVNVSLLVLAQARAFGIHGPLLHDFGMAALLHDIGKLQIPLEVLNKPGVLSDEEWSVMRSHTYEGAYWLGAMPDSPPLSIVVAFEHHLRHDGRENYPRLRAPRIPNLASRMTAVADGFDAMSTVRPYQEPLGRAAACEILKKRSGTFYDPVLVASFIRLLGEAPAGA